MKLLTHFIFAICLIFSVSASAQITGASTVCAGSTTLLSNASPGGIWTSSDLSVATIGSLTGLVTGVNAGPATISYNISGSITTWAVSVNPLPAVITGTASVCEGAARLLSSATTGGTWSTGNSSIGTVSSGTISGVSAGIVNISYQISNGCYRSVPVTVNVTPAAITGTFSVCVGYVTTLSSTTSGGVWSSYDGSIASVGSSTGAVTGVAALNTTIAYTIGSCTATRVVTVMAVPAAITGTAVVCSGATRLLSSTTTGGTWISGNTTIATVSSGTVSGVSSGIAAISYQISNGCYRSVPVTVNATPAAISGTAAVCVGAVTMLSNTVSGGVWSSFDGSIASVGSSTGAVTGVAAMNTTIAYTIGTCAATRSVTVMAVPAAITGTTVVCSGATRLLSSSTTGGTWISGNTTIATVSSGTVSGVSSGIAAISYQISNGCYRSVAVAVNATPAAISGAASVCVGSVTMLSNTVSGGVWSSSDGSIASVGSATGAVTGVWALNATISYSIGTCSASRVVTVMAVPAAITGTTVVCSGATRLLSSTTTGGTWTSSNTAIATVSTGTVSGVSAGIAAISYQVSNGCYRSVTFTVNATPSAIAGTASVCVGAATALTNTAVGGTWVSSNTPVAAVGVSSGIVSGISTGTATISYITGCGTVARAVTVSPQPAAITGTTSVCPGATTSLTSATTGGTWSSSNTGIAVVTSGYVTGIAAGIATISYELSTGCYRTLAVSVNPSPSAITGVNSACIGATTALANTVVGGVWSSSNTAVATVNALLGIVTGVSSATATISYTNGCGTATQMVTVAPSTSAITGTFLICQGTTTTLSNATSGGIWSSSNSAVASVGTSGTVSGAGSGTAIVSYSTGCGTPAVQAISVTATPGAILGTASFCLGITTTLTNTTTGGTWSSSNSAIAVVTSGSVAGVAAGTAIISYNLSLSCYSTVAVTVSAGPSAITGPGGTVPGNIELVAGNGSFAFSGDGGPATAAALKSPMNAVSDASGNIFIADRDNYRIRKVSLSGIITTIAGVGTAGNTGDGGQATAAEVTPIDIAFDASGNLFFADGIASTVRKIDITTGIITKVAGTTGVFGSSGDGGPATAAKFTIPYSLAFDLSGDLLVAEQNVPHIRKISMSTGVINNFAGTGSTGSTGNGGPATAATFTAIRMVRVDASGNVYISDQGNQNVRKVDTSGIVSLIAGNGSAGFSGDGGPATAASVDGPFGVIADAAGNVYIADFINCRVRRVDPSGIISTIAGNGVASNTGDGSSASASTLFYPVRVSFDLSGNILVSTFSGGQVRRIIINGSGKSVCAGSTLALSNSTAGGTWSSGNSNATIGSSSGIVTGVTTGTTDITYTMPGGCYATTTVTINASPATITGATSVCTTATTTLSNTTTGGVWSSSNTAVATVGTSGTVSGVAAGSTTITYKTTTTGCYMTASMLVNSAPGTITGIAAVCTSATTTLSNSVSSGTWSSSNPLVATVSSSSGTVTGVAGGNAVITYSTGCGTDAKQTVTVTGTPGAISGAASLCQGTTTAFSNTISGGIWSSSNTAVATAGATSGIVSGTGSGTATISYSTGCGTAVVQTVTVNAAPAAISGSGGSTTGNIELIAGTGTPGFSGDGGPATSAKFSGPYYALSDASGNTYISDRFNNRIRKVNASGVITTIAGGPSYTYGVSGDGGPATAAFVSPNELVFDAGGNLLFADDDQNTIRKVDLVTGIITHIAGQSWNIGSTGDGGAATSATLKRPSGIAFDLSGDLLIADYGVPRIRKVNMSSGIITNFAGTGSTGSGGDGGPATAATLNSPGDLNVDATGNIYITDWNARKIRRINTAGIIDLVAGNGSSGFGGDGGPATAAAMGPASVVADAAGNVYITDISNHRVRKIDTYGIISTIAGNGTGSSTGDGGSATAATLWQPYGLSFDPSGNIMVADYNGDKIRRIIVKPAGNNVCTGSSITLIDSTAGGTWSSGNTAVATVGTSSGMVTGITAGTVSITYTAASGCAATTTVSVNPLPAAITGATSICASTTTTLSNTTTGGAWSSSNTAVATIGTAGLVTGVTSGFISIIYTLPTGCLVTTAMVVNSAPGTFSGTASLCQGATTTLSNSIAGGTWSSSNTSIAVVGTSGIVTGAGGGSATITYSTGCGTAATKAVTVTPAPGVISGAASACQGSAIALTNTAGGGTWSSSNTTVATVGLSSGIVTGNSTGTATVTYNTSCGTNATKAVTVNAVPAAISGVSTGGAPGNIERVAGNSSSGFSGDGGQATAASLQFPHSAVSDASGNLYIADFANYRIRKVSTSGVITTIAGNGSLGTTGDGGPATAAKIYPLYIALDASGNVFFADPYAMTIREVNITTGIITSIAGKNGVYGNSGDDSAATNATLSYPRGIAFDLSGNLLISDSNVPRIRKVNMSTGIISNFAGTGIRGSTGNGGPATAATFYFPNKVSVDELGNVFVTDDGNSTVRKISASGIVSHVAGNSGHGFSGDGGAATAATFNNPYSAIGDAAGNVYIADYANHRVRKVDPSGIVTTIAGNGTTSNTGDGSPASASAIGYPTGLSFDLSGNIIISSYGGSQVRKIVLTPSGISICVGGNNTLSDATTGGVWSSSNSTVAVVGSATGTVTGIAPGSAGITYMMPGGCSATATVTVNALPVVTGTMNVCPSLTTTLSSSITGGNWSSASTAVATVGSVSGVVTGAAAGTTTITYQLTSTGCFNTASVLVNSAPGTITGTASLCQGATATLSNSIAGGTWSSSNSAVATAGTSSGIVTGTGGGTATITYSNGCGTAATQVVTITPVPAAISGSASVCAGLTTSLTNSVTGGTWASGNTAVATIGTSGIVTGMTGGTAVITYSNGCGSGATQVVTVSAGPAAITGTASVCATATTALSSATTGGTWSSSNTASAIIGTAGVVTGISAGTAVITYALTTGCTATVVITVNPLPAAITGSLVACEGITTSLSSATTGGTWTSRNTAIAMVDASTGVATGLSPGFTTISYTLPTGCLRTAIITVDDVPNAGTLSGSSSVSVGSSIFVTVTVPGGTLSSSDPSIATISPTGRVVGMSTGTVTITYIVTNGCGSDTASKNITVTPGLGRPQGSTGTATLAQEWNVSVLPNPNTGEFTIEGDLHIAENKALALSIFDVLGQKVYSSNLATSLGKFSETISLRDTLANGIYLLYLSEGGNSKVFRLVVSR